MSNWRHAAACRGHKDPELFFCISAPRMPAYKTQVAEAKAVCRTCPVIRECLEYALDKDVDGVYGGTDEYERAKIRDRERVGV